ncbi:hypothetical protein NEMBOFW57_009512 [Staphylotrichum longicolle]|uniref:Ankyrin repeat protein n=1 Tax=Staphylotrichum longicolle TaxID=669026 RepID=A0AAD4HUU4_9PEZI|nr:hypothetical protein NEMBOFW57_009512 [Staphylotrichum longicolle]
MRDGHRFQATPKNRNKPCGSGLSNGNSTCLPTALSEASSKGFLQVVRTLVSHGAAIMSDPPDTGGRAKIPNAILKTCEGLWSLAKHGVLDFLLTTTSLTRPDLDQGVREAMREVALAHNVDVFELISEYAVPDPDMLTLACACGSVSSASRCLDQGVNVLEKDRSGTPPLHSAAYHTHPELVRLVLARGADVNQLDEHGQTPLQHALKGFREFLRDRHQCTKPQRGTIITQFEDIVWCLLDRGAQAERGKPGNAPALQIACEIGYLPVVRLLLDRGVPADSRVEGSDRVLFVALDRDVVGLVALLLGRGEDPNLGRRLKRSRRRIAHPGDREDLSDFSPDSWGAIPEAAFPERASSEEAVSNGDWMFQSPIEAALGRSGPRLMRAFLQSARGLETIPGAVVITAARNLRSDSMMRPKKEAGFARDTELRGRLFSPPSDLQLILENDGPVVVPEGVLGLLAGCDVDEAEHLWKLVLQRGGFPSQTMAEFLKEQRAKADIKRASEFQDDEEAWEAAWPEEEW